MKPVIIFGAGKIAEVIGYYFQEFSKKDIAYYCVDEEYKQKDNINSTPIITTPQLQKKYPPNDYDLFKNRFSDDSEMYPIAKKIQPLLIQFKTGYRNLNIAEKSVNALKKTIQQIQKNG